MSKEYDKEHNELSDNELSEIVGGCQIYASESAYTAVGMKVNRPGWFKRIFGAESTYQLADGTNVSEQTATAMVYYAHQKNIFTALTKDNITAALAYKRGNSAEDFERDIKQTNR